MTTKNNPVKLEITQDKLVDLLMHAATREDIATLRQEVKEDIAKLDARIDKLDDKIEKLEAKMDAKFDKVDAKMDRQFKFLLRMMIGGFFSTIVIISSVMTLMIKSLH